MQQHQVGTVAVDQHCRLSGALGQCLHIRTHLSNQVDMAVRRQAHQCRAKAHPTGALDLEQLLMGQRIDQSLHRRARQVDALGDRTQAQAVRFAFQAAQNGRGP